MYCTIIFIIGYTTGSPCSAAHKKLVLFVIIMSDVGEAINFCRFVELRNDAVIIHNGYKLWINDNDESGLFEALSSTQKHDNGPISISEDGLMPFMVLGSHPALRYRGNAIRRSKIWMQDDYSKGLLRYGYTGWQHAIAPATCSIEAFPCVKKIMDGLNEIFPFMLTFYNMPLCDAKFNHVIFTRYENHEDCIGMHSDKEADFVPGSYFVVIKLGAARRFVFSDRNNKTLFNECLNEGAMIIVKTGKGSSNQIMKHGVPPSVDKCGGSGSLVFRAIQTLIPWHEVAKNIMRAEIAKQRRFNAKQERKRKKQESSKEGKEGKERTKKKQ